MASVSPLTSRGARDSDSGVSLAAARAGIWLGWFSVAAVLIALALGVGARHRLVVLILIIGAALLDASMLVVPRSWWAVQRFRRVLFPVWSGGLLVLVGALVLVAGTRSDLGLLMFLVVAFLATIHHGGARLAWLAVAIGGLTLLEALAGGLSAGGLLLRAMLLAGAAMLAVSLADLSRAAAAANLASQQRAELERLMLAEAHHRVKNSLQTVADLLLLARPEGADGHAFDETADRIAAIAVVHRLLAEARGASVAADELLALIVAGTAPGAEVSAAAVRLDPTVAQHVGIVANELIANAVEHGAAPVRVGLRSTDDGELELTVADAGPGPAGSESGLGLALVERITRQGLGGRFALAHTTEAGTAARVVFPHQRLTEVPSAAPVAEALVR
ncbi:MAG TPA: sensor histidine kinase [Solirubrobacteraceae bacterium]|nr:sensor histidine kinase [Solirubrobacteraceae bacterium]